MDVVETAAIERAKKLFGAEFEMCIRDRNQDYRVAEMFGFRQYRPAEKLGYWLFRIKL